MKKNKSLRNISRAMILLLLLLLSASSIHCATGKKDSVTADQYKWSSGMRGMAQNLEKLMPYVFSREEYSDLNNFDRIQKMIADFANGVGYLQHHAGESLLGADPIIQYSIGRLKSNSRQAQSAFRQGQIEFSRSVLRENVKVCFACHTTQNFGSQNYFTTMTLNANFRLSPIERANYYVATRQFDKAIDSLDNIVQSPTAMLDNPHEQLNALHKYLFLQVRVKNDPGPAIVLLDKYLAWEKLPYFMSADAQSWSDSLRDWQQYQRNLKDRVAFAKRLMKKADSKQMIGYQSGLVDYLRASTLLHESLREAKTKKSKAHIYNLLGQSYEKLVEMGLWDLPDVYYEACIRTLPKSDEAQSCYKSFERSIILGFSGSGGAFILEEERQLMNELRALSGLKIDLPSQFNKNDED